MIIDYDKVRAAGYTVVELEDNIHIIENFISDSDASFLLNVAKNLDEDDWSQEYIGYTKKSAMEQFGTDDLDLLGSQRLISLNKYMYDKSISLVINSQDGDNQLNSVSEKSSDICESLGAELRKFITDDYELSPFGSMRRHYVGDEMTDHSDQQNTPHQRQSCVVYLNDDYNGGELYFRDQKIDVKPKARSIAIFNNGSDYMHGVKKVLEGPTRYTLATYITIKLLHEKAN